MSRMSDRELWVSVFNTALLCGANFQSLSTDENQKALSWDGKIVTASEWAKAVADKALQDAPKDEA